MKYINTLLIAALAVVSTSVSSSAATMMFDFGSASGPSGNNYNNVSPSQLPLFNTIDTNGDPTGIALETSGFNELGSNNAGTTTPAGDAAIFVDTATSDSIFGHSSNFNAGGPRTPGLLNFSGLDASGLTSYSFTFFASRTGGTLNRETLYEVDGANSSTALLDAANNSSNVAIVAGIIPTAGGTIQITASAGSNNTTTPDEFFYIGALRVESSVVPEPATAALVLFGFVGLVASRAGNRRS
jgi:hypothetical protein